MGVAFCHWTFLFSCRKASDANIGIIANVVCLRKTQIINLKEEIASQCYHIAYFLSVELDFFAE